MIHKYNTYQKLVNITYFINAMIIFNKTRTNIICPAKANNFNDQ
jgi:hypothetical protein